MNNTRFLSKVAREATALVLLSVLFVAISDMPVAKQFASEMFTVVAIALVLLILPVRVLFLFYRESPYALRKAERQHQEYQERIAKIEGEILVWQAAFQFVLERYEMNIIQHIHFPAKMGKALEFVTDRLLHGAALEAAHITNPQIKYCLERALEKIKVLIEENFDRLSSKELLEAIETQLAPDHWRAFADRVSDRDELQKAAARSAALVAQLRTS